VTLELGWTSPNTRRALDLAGNVARVHSHPLLGHAIADGSHASTLLLATHVADEGHDLFPHIIQALDPEQWDEIELAHRADEAVWNEPESRQTS
jgi:hypothetical protein